MLLPLRYAPKLLKAVASFPAALIPLPWYLVPSITGPLLSILCQLDSLTLEIFLRTLAILWRTSNPGERGTGAAAEDQ